jgi:hypothetical protein
MRAVGFRGMGMKKAGAMDSGLKEKLYSLLI